MKDIIESALARGILKRIVFSKFADAQTIRVQAAPFAAKGGEFVQFESFSADGKARHTNVPLEKAAAYAEETAFLCRQVNILTSAGECQILTSKKGKRTVVNRISAVGGEKTEHAHHDRDREYIIPEGTPCAFLEQLGICDALGNVFDRKRAKFRQINRFLEIVRDIVPDLGSGELYILDLCCGKSYLSFALYYYFTVVLERKVKMTGADLKKDVIEYCSGVARKCGFTGLEFTACDISQFTPERTPDLVVSLHACDIATDIVLSAAVKNGARVILSSPCCHHEMAKQLAHDDPELGFIFSQPVLRQKFCDITTDALRTLRLEAEGYRVSTLEFIDPDETPKNLMIRAVRGRVSAAKRAEAMRGYSAACERFGLTPALERFLADGDGE